MQLKLLGHIAIVVKVIVIYCPSERVVSIDETGFIKIWNAGRETTGYGELKQTIPLKLSSTSKVTDMSVAFDSGKVFAVQADKLHFFR